MSISLVKDITLALIQWFALLSLRIPVIILGLGVVPLGLLFAKEHHTIREKPWGDWRLIHMPKLFWLWDNKRDGCMGDSRGDYWLYGCPKFIKNNSYLKALWWLVNRNPANNWSRRMKPNSVDVRDLNITLLGGMKNVYKTSYPLWQFVKGSGKINYYGFYALIPFLNGYINIRLGHKISYKHRIKDFSSDPQKAIKGFTFRVLYDR